MASRVEIGHAFIIMITKYLCLIFCTFPSLLSVYCDGNNDGQASLIIIGAGPSGIAVATRLLENNFTNFKILEAENRIGGRINSVRFGDAFVDLGARSCHGEKNNIVYDKVKDLDVLQSINFPAAIYYDGAKLEDRFAEDLMSAIFELIEETGEMGKHNQSIGEYCEGRYNESILSKFRDNAVEEKMALKAQDFLEFQACAIEGSFTSYEPVCIGDYEECDGDKALSWKDKGYRLFLDVLMKKYPDPKQALPIDDKILLGKQVNRICWDSHQNVDKVIIHTSENETFETNPVIFTPSVGVLKYQKDDLFHPTLPVEKARAIDNIGFDAVMKIVVRFPEIWWQDKDGFSVIWDLEDLDKLRKEYPEGPSYDGRPWFTFLRVFLGHAQNPNILIGWATGPIIPKIEEMDEDILRKGMDYVFNKFFGQRLKVPRVDKLIRSQWYTNPHFRGSYSFQSKQTTTKKAGNKRNSNQILSDPLRNSNGGLAVQFAGEATHDKYFGTVHGATEAGYREADRFLKLHKK